MKIDLHCHTKATKNGEDKTRNIDKVKFTEKVIDSDVKIVAITNHNHFDLSQYKEFQMSVKEFCSVWPGVELDIKGVSSNYHLIVIANPQNVKLFDEKLSSLINNSSPNNFSVEIDEVFNALYCCDVLFIPHFHKEPRISVEDINKLNNLIKDESRLFKETSDYRSLGVFSNFDYSVIIGSDVHNWDNYEESNFADIRLPFQTFEQFCLLAKKDKVLIDTLLNKKRCSNISVSPHKSVKFELPFYEDVNIIFGQKGTGKTEIIRSLKNHYEEMNIDYQLYVGSNKDSDFNKLLNTKDMKNEPAKLNLRSMENEFEDINDWKDKLPTQLTSYIEWMKTKDNNKNKKKMKITNSVKLESFEKDENIDKDYSRITATLKNNFNEIEFENYLDKKEVILFKELFNKFINNLSNSKYKDWRSSTAIKLSNWSIDKIKEIADKCSNTISKPSTTGFMEFANQRFRLFKLTQDICEAFNADIHSETEYLGLLEEKGNIYIRSNYRMLCDQSRTKEFEDKITDLRNFKNLLDEILFSIRKSNLLEYTQKFHEFYDDGIKDISHFIGLSKDTVIESDTTYQPSGGEKGILVLQRVLNTSSDVYLLDEPELGMGNSFINASILPKIVEHAKNKKTVVVATHNANIAVRTLPYTSIFRMHVNGVYSTYVGNPFRDALVNIDNESDYRNWTNESMHTLEGGFQAFYERKDIYESGTKNY